MIRLICFFCCCLSVLQAQTLENPLDTFSREPIPILVEPLRFPENTPVELVQWLENDLYTTLEDHWHFQVVNHSRQANTGEIDPEYIFQLSLEPIIDEVSQSDVRDSLKQVISTNISIQAGVLFNLRVTNINTGELTYAREVKSVLSGLGRKRYASRTWAFLPPGKRDWKQAAYRPLPLVAAHEEAELNKQKDRVFDQALQDLDQHWTRVLNKVFPVAQYVKAVVDGSPQKPNQIEVNVGSSMGMQKNIPWELYTIKVYEALGEVFVRRNVIAYFTPKEVATHTTTGQVTGDKKDLGAALTAGQQVYCRPRTGWMFGG